MNFSAETLELLQNFASINKSILFLEGKKQRTLAPTQSVFAEVELKEEFPQEFAIYDLNQMLGVLSLFDNPTLSFKEGALLIEQGNQRVVYKFCNPELISYPPKD
jgi:hypothetical protein